MCKFFIVDDEDDVLLMVKTWFTKKGYEVTTFNNANNLLEKAIALHPDLILIDINLKGKDGRIVCQRLKSSLPFSVKIILLSGDPMALLPYQDHYADGVLNKPFEYEDMEKKIQQHLRYR